ncbi:hypothetical protein GA0116948_1463 [Chitinophaga costaii]|uniref:Uncharacterized protein n=1 Tax=Chitinophaga costaii TaxID=1335309 RepID=A0A1C4GAJ4_9BACT|nr:hypothetical protein [Chitinophaga costaii]PUZ19141.1 hypothetical protein DCM91_20870 [Chitinophaga costaii]SCC65212.1 hypothetical protein GA0116948_1463 [Chitinophaga costaii]
MPIQEGESKALFSTKSAEKTLKQAENSLAANTGTVPTRKISAVANAKKELENLNNVNSTYNKLMEGIKGGVITTTATTVRDQMVSPPKP